jgi:hypothetical protein
MKVTRVWGGAIASFALLCASCFEQPTSEGDLAGAPTLSTGTEIVDDNSTPASIQKQSSSSDDQRTREQTPPRTLAIYGLPYPEARQRLIELDWYPVRSHRYPEDLAPGREKAIWNFGFQEIEACAGTGLANCTFKWSSADGKILTVYTIGEEIAEFNSDWDEYIGEPDFKNMTVDSISQD